MTGVELADLRLYLQVDEAAAEHGWSEREAHAEGLVGDGDRAERPWNRDRVFTAREEARGITGQCDEIRLGQCTGAAFLLKRVELHVDRMGAAEEPADQEPERRGARQDAAGHDLRDGLAREI